MNNIIHYLLTIIQDQQKQIKRLILFICKYIPLKQWAHAHALEEIHGIKLSHYGS